MTNPLVTCVKNNKELLLEEFWKQKPLYPPPRKLNELNWIGRTIHWLRDTYPQRIQSIIKIFEAEIIPRSSKVVGLGLAIAVTIKYNYPWLLLVCAGAWTANYLFSKYILEEYHTQENELGNQLKNAAPDITDIRLKLERKMNNDIQDIIKILKKNSTLQRIPVVEPNKVLRREWDKEVFEQFSNCFMPPQNMPSSLVVSVDGIESPFVSLRVKEKGKDQLFVITLYPRYYATEFEWIMIPEKGKPEDSTGEGGIAAFEKLIVGTHPQFEIAF